MSYIHPFFPVSKYFREVLPDIDWQSVKVLDFGGASGNFLRDPDCITPEENYTCIDVSKASVEKGKLDFPKAQWLTSESYNYAYNPEGVRSVELATQQQFDVIIAYSVFTHMFAQEQEAWIRELKKLLNPGGSIAFTFVGDLHINFFLEKRRLIKPDLNTSQIEDQIKNSDFCVLVDEDELHIEKFENQEINYSPDRRERHLVSFYKEEKISSLFPRAKIFTSDSQYIQHCCILKFDN